MLEQLEADISAALRSSDKRAATTLRMLKSALHNAEISKGETLTEAEVMRVVQKEAKQRKESIESYQAAGRDDRGQEEQLELEIIERYLPEAIDENELTLLVQAAIDEVGAESPADIGAVMKVLQPKIAGRADGGKVAAEVRAKLS